jgi:hypothetical protein
MCMAFQLTLLIPGRGVPDLNCHVSWPGYNADAVSEKAMDVTVTSVPQYHSRLRGVLPRGCL